MFMLNNESLNILNFKQILIAHFDIVSERPGRLDIFVWNHMDKTIFPFIKICIPNKLIAFQAD